MDPPPACHCRALLCCTCPMRDELRSHARMAPSEPAASSVQSSGEVARSSTDPTAPPPESDPAAQPVTGSQSVMGQPWWARGGAGRKRGLGQESVDIPRRPTGPVNHPLCRIEMTNLCALLRCGESHAAGIGKKIKDAHLWTNPGTHRIPKEGMFWKDAEMAKVCRRNLEAHRANLYKPALR